MALTARDVAAFAGRPDDVQFVEAAWQALPVVTEMIRAYTRGEGFTQGRPDAAIEAVIVSAAARLAANPTGDLQESIGDYSIRPGIFAGYTIAELGVLQAYRVTEL